MKTHYYLLGCLTLAACDEAAHLETAEPVVVSFAQPFPAGSPDLPGFLPRHRGQYTAPHDTSWVFVVGDKALVKRRFEALDVPGAWLDSMRLPRRPGSGLGPGGRRYTVQALAPDSFRLRAEALDTVLQLAGPHAPRLRYYRGYYYVSTPAVPDSTKWRVRRLALASGQITQQVFNPDSLRVRALDPATVQQRRADGQLLITLAPQSRRAIGQVSSYAGLWLGPE